MIALAIGYKTLSLISCQAETSANNTNQNDFCIRADESVKTVSYSHKYSENFFREKPFNI